MNTRGFESSGQKKKRVPSSELRDIVHLPGDVNVIKPVNTAPTFVTSALLANNPVDRGKEMLGTDVLTLER